MNQKHPQGFRPDVQTQQYSEENGHFSREKKTLPETLPETLGRAGVPAWRIADASDHSGTEKGATDGWPEPESPNHAAGGD